MKVRALQAGHLTYYREKGEVFQIPEGTPLGHADPLKDADGKIVRDDCDQRASNGRCLHAWMEIVPEDTPTTAEYPNGAKRVECHHCGLVVKGKFCSECGTAVETLEHEQKSEELRADAIQGITGKRPIAKKNPGRPKKDQVEAESI